MLSLVVAHSMLNKTRKFVEKGSVGLSVHVSFEYMLKLSPQTLNFLSHKDQVIDDDLDRQIVGPIGMEIRGEPLVVETEVDELEMIIDLEDRHLHVLMDVEGIAIEEAGNQIVDDLTRESVAVLDLHTVEAQE